MPTFSLRTRIAPLAVATALVGGLVATTTAVAPDARAASGSYYLYFKKNTSNPINSKLYLMKSVANAKDKVVARYRAGSGNGSQNECATNKGWLPGTNTKNGKYKIEFHRTNFDGIINGYVIKLSDKKCTQGDKRTKRTALFVHSEMKPNGKQGTIESERWDGTRDYYSNGCIKLKPADIKDLFAKAKRYGWPKTLYVVK
ncbi:L,D-transpeptidase family protein [Streptomyces sp. NPDC057238]|uniref:L,D-transpeptidase family protein n=1 Tax=unclassified Streptomyces TaxID=2593676 RepID=UPI003636F436